MSILAIFPYFSWHESSGEGQGWTDFVWSWKIGSGLARIVWSWKIGPGLARIVCSWTFGIFGSSAISLPKKILLGLACSAVTSLIPRSLALIDLCFALFTLYFYSVHYTLYNVYLSLYTLYTIQSMPPGEVPGWQQPVHTSLLLWPTAVIYEEDTNERWQFGDNMVIYIYRKYEIYINISWITRPFHRSKIVPIADFITRPRLTGRPDWLRVANTSSHSWN